MDLPQFQVHAAIEERHWWFQARRTIMQAILDRIAPPSPDRLILDVGCGTGGNTAAFADRYRCIGIDPTTEAITFAKKRFPQLEFRLGYAPDDVPDLMREADVVFLMDVLEHVEDDFAIISKLLSAMKPGAHLLLMAPADISLWSQHDAGFDHYRRYDLDRLRKTWEGLPVMECIVSYCNTHLYPLIKIARVVGRTFKHSWGPADTDLSLPSALVNNLLFKIFAREAKVFGSILDKKRSRGFRHGVSVLALLRREEGEIIPRMRPEGLKADERPWKN